MVSEIARRNRALWNTSLWRERSPNWIEWIVASLSFTRSSASLKPSVERESAPSLSTASVFCPS